MIQADITVAVHKGGVMQALRDLTLNDPSFNPDPWSIGDAEDLEAAARMIRREIAYREGRKAGSK